MSVSATDKPTRKVLLASASPARRQTLISAGMTPLVEVADLDEDAILADLRSSQPDVSPAVQVQTLATAKARSILDSVDARRASGVPVSQVLVACDSMFEFDVEVVGKPYTEEVAFERLSRMAGNTGVLWTGHAVANIATGEIFEEVSKAVIHMAPMDEVDIRAYIATGEPLRVAGSFTIDGVGGPFIDGIEGDHHGVVGLSLPTFRRLVEKMGLRISDLWDDDAGRKRRPIRLDHPRMDADGFVDCACGQRHWGLNGGAGLVLWRIGPGGQIQVLLQLRSAWTHMGGRWSTAGGAIGMTESPIGGGLREFSEETGIDPALVEFDGSWTVSHPDWQYVNFACHLRDQVDVPIVANSESEQLAWVNIDEVHRLELLPAFRTAFGHLEPIIREAAARL